MKWKSTKGLLQEWLNWASVQRAPGTVKKYSVVANNYISIVGDHDIRESREIAIRNVDKLIAGLTEKGLAATTINLRLDVIRVFYNWAAKRVEKVMVPDIEHLEVEVSPPAVLSEGEVMRLLERIQSLWSKAHRAKPKRNYLNHLRFLMIAIHSGMRRSEICFLPWGCVDLEKGMIRVRGNAYYKIKERHAKDLPLTRQLAAYLSEQAQGRGTEKWVLDDGKGNPAYPDPHGISTAFRRHFKAIGLGDSGVKAVHSFRALYAGRLRDAKVDLNTIQGLLGHRQIQTTQLYFPHERGIRVEAVKALPDFGTPTAHPPSDQPQLTDNKEISPPL